MQLSLPDTDTRLEQAIRSALKIPGAEWISRAAFDELFQSGRVQSITGKRLKPGQRVSELAEKTVSIDFPAEDFGLVAAPGLAEPLAEADTWLAVNKASGVDSYPLRPWERGTLAQQIVQWGEAARCFSRAEFEALAEPPVLEGGLVQRLDRDTSGCLLVALTKAQKDLFRKEISLGRFRKHYLVLVEGVAALKTPPLTLWLKPSGNMMKAFNRQEEGAEKATLEIELMARGAEASLLKISSSQGQRHIVRAACAYLQLPLVGDRLYGASSQYSVHQLHASTLEYLGGESFPGHELLRRGISAPLPDDFRRIMRELNVSES